MRWVDFWSLREKKISWACLLGSGLKLMFHWKTQLFFLFKSWFNLFAYECLSFIYEKSDVSSANSVGFEIKFAGKSYIYMKKISGPKIEPWGTPAGHLKLLFVYYHLEN